MASVSSSRSQRSSAISPFRSRKSPVPPLPVNRQAGRPATPSPTASSRPPSKLSISPVISASATPSPSTLGLEGHDVSKEKENVTVTVRFRPLSVREINKGDEISWYSDGDHTVRNESNPSISYGFDRVFGPATTTRHVYDVAAHHVIDGAMQGINGTVFAYGVTSSGKTHTMHGEQKSPGIIPLAVKDVFAIIQETPGREFLLRVSYLEIYNEVINDLLNPTGQNLRVREDVQGTYVEGIKEEVVLSPAHALSLIASGEEHRHVGSNNFNLLSSRSHTIFTMSIESSPCGGHHGEEDVSFSQLHLIDLAGSESSKTETTGLRRKEGSYINKSLLTLGTVISKLTDEKATHVPFRDSKLTRLLQSSLSGHGRVSLICTVTPASSNSEETHNTLKFAHRSKRVEIKASQNKIMDEKSLIKKYQKEISSLKKELQQLKQGMMESPHVVATTQEDLVNLKLQLEADQMKMQTRLEEEEQAKAALMGRIQRLTKLILVSTKNTLPSNVAERPVPRRRHSFGEDELAYLPDKKRDYMNDDDSGSFASELSAEGRDDAANLDEFSWDSKRNKRRGMLGWFKLRKPENLLGLPSTPGSDSSGCDSPACGMKSSQNRLILNENRKSVSVGGDDSSFISSYQEQTQAGDLFCAAIGNRCMPSTGTTITDQMDLLREQLKMLAGEIALSTSSLKRLSKQAARNPDDSQLKECMQKLKDEISEKKHQMHVLEKRMIKSVEMSPHIPNGGELFQALSKLTIQLNEKTFELEIKAADNRILQEQLQTKIAENVEMQDTILLQRQQLNSLSEKCSSYSQRTDDIDAFQLKTCSQKSLDLDKGERNQVGFSDIDIATPTSVMSFSRVILQEDSKERKDENILHSQVLMQAAEIENLRQDKVRLIEERDGLEVQSRKLAEEASYAKELAAAAAVELQNLAKEVTKLSYSNAKLTSDLAAAHGVQGKLSSQRSILSDTKRGINNGPRSDRTSENEVCIGELQRELNVRYQREAAFEKTLSEREQTESELRRKLNEAKQHEEYLENELASMWGMIAKMRKSGVNTDNISTVGVQSGVEEKHLSFGKVKNGDEEEHGNLVKIRKLEDLKVCYKKERMRCKELESLVSRLKGEEISDLNVAALEDLQNLHVEALTKICQAKDETLLRPCRTDEQSENLMMFGCSLIIVEAMVMKTQIILPRKFPEARGNVGGKR